MTEKEILEFSNRLEAASLLSKDVQYNSITESTGLSSKTIARIAKWLNGSLGGYRLILNRITQNQSKLGTGHSNSSKIRKGLFFELVIILFIFYKIFENNLFLSLGRGFAFCKTFNRSL